MMDLIVFVSGVVAGWIAGACIAWAMFTERPKQTKSAEPTWYLPVTAEMKAFVYDERGPVTAEMLRAAFDSKLAAQTRRERFQRCLDRASDGFTAMHRRAQRAESETVAARREAIGQRKRADWWREQARKLGYRTPVAMLAQAIQSQLDKHDAVPDSLMVDVRATKRTEPERILVHVGYDAGEELKPVIPHQVDGATVTLGRSEDGDPGFGMSLPAAATIPPMPMPKAGDVVELLIEELPIHWAAGVVAEVSGTKLTISTMTAGAIDSESHHRNWANPGDRRTVRPCEDWVAALIPLCFREHQGWPVPDLGTPKLMDDPGAEPPKPLFPMAPKVEVCDATHLGLRCGRARFHELPHVGKNHSGDECVWFDR